MASNPPCTAAASGPCANTPARQTRTPATAATASLLDQGQTGLSVAFDLPTQIGYDSDAPEARGEVGKVGVAIDSLDDMRTLFDGIPLDRVTTSMTINSTAGTLLALYAAVAEQQGLRTDAIGGHDSKRYPQGVRGSRDVHLPARALHAPDHQHPRLLHP